MKLIQLSRVVIFFLLLAPSANAAQRQVLHGHVPNAVRQLSATKRFEGTNRLQLSIALPLRNSAELKNLLEGLYDPASPRYHHYLGSEAFANEFGPTESDYNALIAFAKRHNFAIVGKHPNRTLLDVAASVADIEKAFQINLRVYQHPHDSRTFHAPDTEPSVDLLVPLLSISGLDDFNLPRPMSLNSASFQKAFSRLDSKDLRNSSLAGPKPFVTGSGPRAAFIGKDFRTAYAPGVSLDGAGQAIGLFQLDGYFPTDIVEFKKLAGLPDVPITNVMVNGGIAVPGDGNMEVALDIEMALSVAPGLSKVIVYEGTGANANAILNRMATDNLAKQLSSSWGFGSPVDPAREQIFQQFAAQGQSMFQASGDDGAWYKGVFPPSDDPWLTIVGGTSLDTVTAGGAWQSETTWSGSGGGISTNYPIPAWQQGINMAGNQGSTTMRNIPDVAAHSDFNIWVIVNNGEEGTVGGTSAAAPLWAAYTALINQQAAANGQPSVGFLNPAIYAIGNGPTYSSAFHDITSGNNTNINSSNKFSAVPGFDLCTGWGTPTGSNLINSLAGPQNPLRILPFTDFIFTGPPSGPFTPAAQTYTLTNAGSASLNWSLANTSLWLHASVGNGTLLPGGPPESVILSLNSAASNLVVGNYTATVLFTNQADQSLQSRTITLAIVSPPNAPDVILTTLYSFSGGNDGANPNGLTLASNGLLHGTTQHGGTNGAGTIFSTKPSGAFVNIYSFAGDTNGAAPFASVLEGPDGRLYGTAFQGGAFDNGTVFRINPRGGGFTNLVSLNVPLGDLPYAGLTPGLDGNFYGAGYQGGTAGGTRLAGTIFKMTPLGLLTTIYSFSSGASDGGFPHASLTRGIDGNFYGTTHKGGAFNYGTVFRVTTNGNLTTLTSFDNTNGAFSYAALARAEDGTLYGTTAFGGSFSNGTIFKIAPSGQFSSVYSFPGGIGGAQPMAALFSASDGNIYGTTANGGTFGLGTVFRLLPDGTITNLVHFDGIHGASPQAPLAEGSDGNLYGTTQYGGASGNGTIFQIAFDSAPRIVTSPVSQSVFTGANVNMSVTVTGSRPLLYQWKAHGTNLLDGGNISGSTSRVLTFDGVMTNNAGVYSVVVSNTLGWVQSADATLTVTSSLPIIVTQPTNVTISPGGTAIFAVNAIGTQPLSYQWRSNGFNLADGGNVSGSTSSALTIPNATEGNNAGYSVLISNVLGSVVSTNAILTIIPASAPGTRLTTLYSFSTGINGSNPNGLVVGTNGVMYGTTRFGGVPGTVFAVYTNGAVIAPFALFHGTNGSQPRAPLVAATDGNLYGTTQFGGTNSSGSIFRLGYDGALDSLYIFPCDDNGCTNGANPFAPLVQGADGDLYGATTMGGSDGFGTLFKISANGTFTTLYSFTNGTDGIGPTNGLIQAADGNFYGVTSAGALGQGNVFRMSPDGIFTNLYTFNGGPNGGGPNTLIQGSDGYFYGTTAHSSISTIPFYGIVFRMDAKGNLGPLYTLNFTDGRYPAAGLVEASDGNFYGTTYGGGSATLPGNGTLFRVAPNGAFATLASFDGFNTGANPISALVQGPDGNLYGTTSTGGWGGRGTVFRFGYTTAPQIVAQPANQPIWPGGTARFFVTVAGASPFTYQWRRSGTNLTDGANILGATLRTLTLSNVSFADGGTYSVVVSNSLGYVTSDNALLAVLFPPQFQTATRSNNSFVLTWSAVQGQRYQLQSRLDLKSGNWANLGGQRTATGATISVSDPIASNSRKFYRVIMLP